MKFLTSVSLGAALICTLPRVAAAVEQNQVAQRAAFVIIGGQQFRQAFLNKCRQIDSANATLYDGINGALLTEDLPVVSQIDNLLDEEGTRSGSGLAPLCKMLGLIHETETELVDGMQVASPEEFLAKCRAAPEAAKRHSGDFAPLGKLFSAEMRKISEWR